MARNFSLETNLVRFTIFKLTTKSPQARRLLKMIILLFAFVFAFVASPLQAEAVPESANLKQTKMVLAEQANKFLETRELAKAAVVIDKIRELDLKDPLGHELAVKYFWMLNKPSSIVWLVYYIEQHYGVRNLRLYQQQAKALYVLGGYSAVPQALDEIENFLRETPPERAQ